MTDKIAGAMDKPRAFEPFPTLFYAIRNRWGLLDHWAYRRLERLSVPDPWTAFQMGVMYAEAKQRKEPFVTIPPPFVEKIQS